MSHSLLKYANNQNLVCALCVGDGWLYAHAKFGCCSRIRRQSLNAYHCVDPPWHWLHTVIKYAHIIVSVFFFTPDAYSAHPLSCPCSSLITSLWCSYIYITHAVFHFHSVLHTLYLVRVYYTHMNIVIVIVIATANRSCVEAFAQIMQN